MCAKHFPMENFSGNGEEVERALMDLGGLSELGGLLGVSVKEETPDPSQPNTSAASTPQNPVSTEEPSPESQSRAEPCVMCGESLMTRSGTPRLMVCLHSICEPCLNAKVEEKQNSNRDFLGAERFVVVCPTCRLQCSPSEMIEQRFVLEKIASEQQANNSGVVSSHQCNSCEDTEPATSYCVDCAEFICQNCVTAHQRLKITKDHTIKSKEEAVNELPTAHDMFCTEHPQERLSLFCETCDVLTCRDCQLQQHRSHRYQFAAEMATSARHDITVMLQEVSYKRVLLASAMKVITDRQLLIADKKKALVHEITQNVVKLTNAINTRGKQLVLRLNEVCDSKQRTLFEKKRALEHLARVTDHCVNFVNSALSQDSRRYLKSCQDHRLENADFHETTGHTNLAKQPEGSDTAVLHSKRAVCGHLQRIKSRRADIPNPEIPVRISFSIDNLPEVIAALSNIGNIVVDGKSESGPQPPPPPAYPLAPAAAPHVANMHQSYAQSMSGGGHRSTPLRHGIVSSSTHPPPEVQLRNLLHRGQMTRLPHPFHHQQHQQHQQQHQHQQQQQMYHVMNSYAAAGGYMNMTANNHSPSNVATMTTAGRPNIGAARWHIPEGGTSGLMGGAVPIRPREMDLSEEYKIPLRTNAVPNLTQSSPSPRALDAVAQDAVSDLMATIAKLDSNGVQVLPETSPAPPVHSSTADPNEDWCAVCMDGGELMCCDRCPKVFHQYCHIPVIEHLPDDTASWQCLLCVKFAEIPADINEADENTGLTGRRRRAVERLTLELYCQYEPSLSFRAAGLDRIRERLQPVHAAAYTRVEQFVIDVRTMFREARAQHPPDAQIHKDANYLEEFFEAQLTKLIPEFSCWTGDSNAAPDTKRPRLQ